MMAEVQFKRMAPAEVIGAAARILYKISIITGWAMPTDTDQDVLVDQFSRLLIEKYPSVNESEFDYAFRNFSEDVKDFGKSVNLSLISQVMEPYLKFRNEAFRQSTLSRPLLKESTGGPLSDSDWDEWLKSIKGYAIPIVPVSAYEYLEKKKGMIVTNEMKHSAFSKAIQMKLSSCILGSDEYRTIIEWQKEKRKDKTWESLRDLSMKIIVHEFLNKEK